MEEINYQDFNLDNLGLNYDEQFSQLTDDPDTTREMRDLLEDARVHWYNLQFFRDRRERVREFYRGNQYNDVIDDPDNEGETITEKEYILRQGKIPLKNNQLRQLGKNLIGQYRENDYKPVAYPVKNEDQSTADMMTNALQGVQRDNQLKEDDTRAFEEFLISGYIAWKCYVEWDSMKDMNDIMCDRPHGSRMFWNTDISDIRGKDFRFIGELHDMSLDEVIRTFAQNDEDEQKIRDWYEGYGDSTRADWSAFIEEDIIDGLDFYWTNNEEKMRVYEIWRKELVQKTFIHDHLEGEYYETDLTEEEIAELNLMRIMNAESQGISRDKVPLMEMEVKKEMAWFYYFLTPKGNVLAHGESNYEHQEHPYTIRLYPLIDSQIYGFFEDIIDQQKQINRLITLLDFMIGAGAKGVLMVPEDMVPDGWDREDFVDEWTRYNGVIFYKATNNHGHAPQQITANTQNSGAADMLQLQLNLLQQISGVNDAIQGHAPSSGTPASLYAQQTNNAAISNKDFFEFFYSAQKARDTKMVNLIQQFYTEKRWVRVAGNDAKVNETMYDPDLARDMRYDIVIGAGSNNPVYRQIQDEYLMKFWEAGGIDLEMFLENSALPFSDKLLQSLEKKKQELQEAGTVNPLMMQALQGAA